VRLRTLGDPCPDCGGTDYYCATEVNKVLDWYDKRLNLVAPPLKEIRGFANDCFGGPSSMTDCIDLVLGELEE